MPFEATRKELRELLSAFGELTSIRLPKKFDGKHRGFAFADFVTASISQKRKLKNLHSSFTRKIRNLYSSFM